jgi:4-carboxymuconolactone decarboxylase
MDRDILFSDAMRMMVRVAAAVAAAPMAITRRVLLEADGVAPAAAVEEVLLQSCLFAGFPRALNAMRVWREVSGEPAPAEDEANASPDSAEVHRRGEEACRLVYGDKYDALRGAIASLHPALDAWMLEDGYGKVLSRTGLTLAQRELCIVAACAASEQLPQLKSHLYGALNCGATADDLAQTLSALTDIVPREALGAAREELHRIKETDSVYR